MSDSPKLTVLYIDDNLDNGDMLIRRLARHDVNCIVSDNGFKAIDLIIEHNPDVVMLDINMPGIDGFGILELIRAHETFSHLPVWAFTANSIGDVKQKCFDAGFNGFIAKPIMRHDITEFVNTFSGV